MSNVNYQTMSLQELKELLRKDRQNTKAWDVFFDKLNREKSNRIPLTDFNNLGELETAISNHPELSSKF